MLAAVEAVHAVQEAKKRLSPELQGKGLFSSMTLWHYKSEGTPEHRCEYCDAFNGRDFLGSAIRTIFPDMIVVDEFQIYVNYHATLWGKMDTCKCYLWREGFNASTIFGEEPEELKIDNPEI